jgi:hypothetical protein
VNETVPLELQVVQFPRRYLLGGLAHLPDATALAADLLELIATVCMWELMLSATV